VDDSIPSQGYPTYITNEYLYIEILEGFKPGNLKITFSLRFGRKSVNSKSPLPPKPDDVWSAIFCSELRVISKIMTLH
jgi:hypothetical protein